MANICLQSSWFGTGRPTTWSTGSIESPQPASGLGSKILQSKIIEGTFDEALWISWAPTATMDCAARMRISAGPFWRRLSTRVGVERATAQLPSTSGVITRQSGRCAASASVGNSPPRKSNVRPHRRGLRRAGFYKPAGYLPDYWPKGLTNSAFKNSRPLRQVLVLSLPNRCLIVKRC